jgi:hypothetical protein
MALFKPSTWGISKVRRDIVNYRDFVRTIKKEKSNKSSKFNKWKLNHNYFYTIYFTIDIEEGEAQLPEDIKRYRIIEMLAPLHRYLDEELGFAECLTPEFNQFYDDDGEPSLTYLIAYRFVFTKLSFWWFIKFLIKLGLLITAIVLFFKHDVIGWVQGLI